MMDNKKKYGLNIGASSILIVIVILCLVCFAGLSVASANADFLLSEKLATRTTDYYEACNQAQLVLKDLNQELVSIYESSASSEEYEQKIKESLTDSLTFYCNMNDNQSLEVSILPLYPENTSRALYEITTWKVITLSMPELDESLPVLLGN